MVPFSVWRRGVAASGGLRACALGLAALLLPWLGTLPALADGAPGYTVVSDLTYNAGAGSGPQLADLYLPSGAASGVAIPVVVVIHGGEWKHGSKKDGVSVSIAETLATNGIAALSIDYTLWNPKVPAVGSWPQNLEDCKTAVQWLRLNAGQYNLDPDQIGVAGSSAGAQLAAMVAMTDAQHGGFEPGAPYPGVSTAVQATFLMYCPCVDLSVPGRLAPFLGSGATQAEQDAATPVNYVRGGLSPTVLVHGLFDTLVPVVQSITFHADLDAADVLPGSQQSSWRGPGPLVHSGSATSYIQMQWLGHGFPIADTNWKGWDYDLRPNLVSFFQANLPLRMNAPGG